jgi:hypothetical protein
MASIVQQIRSVRSALEQASKSPLAQQVGKTLARDLPALLLELSALTPVQAQDVSQSLRTELAKLSHVCLEERKALGSRGSRNPLAVRMSLARLLTAIEALESTLSWSAAALRHSDPRVAAIKTAAPAPFAETGQSQRAATRHCRQAIEDVRVALKDVASGAQRVQARLHGERADDPAAITSAISQARVLAATLRSAHDVCRGQVSRSVDAGAA